MANVIELTEEDFNKVKQGAVISGYGEHATFYNSVEELAKSPKIVALNGSALREIKGRVQSSIEDRLSGNNVVVKLPSNAGKFAGKYAVLSKTHMQKAGLQFVQSRTQRLTDIFGEAQETTEAPQGEMSGSQPEPTLKSKKIYTTSSKKGR
jgi:hypothetical protein